MFAGVARLQATMVHIQRAAKQGHESEGFTKIEEAQELENWFVHRPERCIEDPKQKSQWDKTRRESQ